MNPSPFPTLDPQADDTCEWWLDDQERAEPPSAYDLAEIADAYADALWAEPELMQAD